MICVKTLAVGWTVALVAAQKCILCNWVSSLHEITVLSVVSRCWLFTIERNVILDLKCGLPLNIVLRSSSMVCHIVFGWLLDIFVDPRRRVVGVFGDSWVKIGPWVELDGFEVIDWLLVKYGYCGLVELLGQCGWIGLEVIVEKHCLIFLLY